MRRNCGVPQGCHFGPSLFNDAHGFTEMAKKKKTTTPGNERVHVKARERGERARKGECGKSSRATTDGTCCRRFWWAQRRCRRRTSPSANSRTMSDNRYPGSTLPGHPFGCCPGSVLEPQLCSLLQGSPSPRSSPAQFQGRAGRDSIPPAWADRCSSPRQPSAGPQGSSQPEPQPQVDPSARTSTPASRSPEPLD